MNATIPNELKLVVVLDGAPLPRAWVAVTLPMKSKNPFRLLFGPSSEAGTLSIQRQDIEREISKVRDLFLMDYADPTTSWSGELIVHPLNRTDIANLLLAYDAFGSTGFYPEGLPGMLSELDGLLSGHEGGQLGIEAMPIEEEGTRVVATSRPVD